MKQRIAVVYGGYSGESIVSEKSAQMILDNIDKSRYDVIPVQISKTNWTAKLKNEDVEIDKNDFSVTDSNSNHLNFDGVFNIVHGTPGEDGLLQGYFQMLGIPHTSGDALNMSLTFNKVLNNNFLKQLGFQCAESVLLKQTDHYSISKIISTLGLPCFVKPNQGGSSLGISKVSDPNDLVSAIELAFQESHQVIIEEFIQGRELTCGVITRNGRTMALPLTEIISNGDFFDYSAKYEGNSQEITPAQIDLDLTLEVQNISSEVYDLLECRGMARIDFILSENGPYVIEVNTVPGFSEVSLIPQQAAAAGISTKELISTILEETI